jgi:hypothetical protein
MKDAPAPTGWHDEHGNPAPWPDDFFDPDRVTSCRVVYGSPVSVSSK